MKLRIGTWNVEYALKSRRSAQLDVFEKHPADIWILTETHDSLTPAGCDYVVHSDQRKCTAPGIRAGSRQVSIWSHYPIIEQHTLKHSRADRAACAEVSVRGGNWLIFGTVLPWHADGGLTPETGRVPNWSEHHREIDAQVLDWFALKSRFKDHKMCIAGDYNTDMGTGRVYGTKKGIQAIRSGLDQVDLFCTTEPARYSSPLIDHIALPKVFEASASICGYWSAAKKVLSDHSGVIAEISL